jgi:hypothetical protein
LNLVSDYSPGYFAAGLPDLAAAAGSGDLASLEAAVQDLEQRAVAWFESNAVEKNVLADVAELQDLLDTRTSHERA